MPSHQQAETRNPRRARRLPLLLVAGAAMLGAACAATSHYEHGSRIDPVALESFQVGRSNKAEVVSRFGNPTVQMTTVNDYNYYDARCGERGLPVDLIIYTYTVSDSHHAFGSGVESSSHSETTTFLFKEGILCAKPQYSRIGG